MSHRYVQFDPQRVNIHKLGEAAKSFNKDGQIAVLPTDTSYVLACRLGDKRAIARIQLIRTSNFQFMTLLLPDFGSLGAYAEVDNRAFRLMKDIALGGYTFIFRATKDVPRAFAHKKRKTIGVRIPAHAGFEKFAKSLDVPLICCSLRKQDSKVAFTSLDDHLTWLAKVVDLVVDFGELKGGETTILDMTADGKIEIDREGVGPTDILDAK